jgi:ADP-ribose pyrophosphatase YjhB (NUDIX family)
LRRQPNKDKPTATTDAIMTDFFCHIHTPQLKITLLRDKIEHDGFASLPVDFAIELMNRPQSEEIQIICKEPETWLKDFSKHFHFLEAAGGVVVNPSGDILMIDRLGKCDLPKGKIETGENPETAALREVEEECGVHDHSITRFLIHTYHTYELDQQPYLKKTHWFEMHSAGVDDLKPQTEESITSAYWKAAEELIEYMDTYASIREVIGKHLAQKKAGT